MNRSLNRLLKLLAAALPAALMLTSAACGAQNESGANACAVVINEAVTSGGRIAGCEGSPDWFELYNTGSSAFDLGGCVVSDNGSGRFVFPAGAKLAAGGYAVVVCDESAASAPEGTYLASFGLSKKGDTLTLKTPEGELLQRLVLPPLESGVSYARMDDGSFGYCSSPTPGGANTGVADEPQTAQATEPAAMTPGALIINELRNGSEGWAELFNASQQALELRRYYLSDDADEPFKFRLPDESLEAGGYLVIELNGLETDSPYAASFKLSRAEDTLYLNFEDGRTADKMTIDPQLPDCVSAVHTEDGTAYTAHITRGAANSESTFAELVWTRADDMPVIINELLPDNKYGITDAEGDRSDWLELYNRSDEAVSLAGLWLSDRQDDPERWALPDITLEPGEYLLIFLSGKDCREGELHTSFGISKKDAGVYLFDYDGMRFNGLDIPGELNANVSIGLGADGKPHYYPSPTPGEENTTYGFDDFAGLGGFSPNGVYISEVSGVARVKSGENDWVELFNATGAEIDITGWRLASDPFECYAVPFPAESDEYGNSHYYEPGNTVFFSSVLKPGQYLVCGVPFGISQSGETLYLFDSEGAIRDIFKTGVTEPNVTSGRETRSQTGERVFFTQPTKGSANAEPVYGYAAEVKLGNTALYCGGAFELTLTCATNGAEIRYTLNGSAPTERSQLYTGPINISGGTVVRARAYANGLAPGPVTSHTYVFGAESELPVVCIALDQGDYSRMYTASQSANGGITKGPEVPCSVEYYIDGLKVFETGAGVKVSGASTSLYAQKSLGLYFRAGYGRKSVEMPLFEGCGVTSFRSLVLRNGGQDVYTTRIRDSYMSSLCQGMNIDVAYYRPVIVYVNGDYRGIYDLKENMNEDYVAAHYGVDPDDVDVIKRNGMLLNGSKLDWQSLRQFCQTADFSNKANYERLCELVDADSIMDYVAARTYFYDGDMFNQKYWRSEGTLKWRAVFYDSDYAMMGNSPAANILPSYFNKYGVSAAHGSKTNMDIYCALVQNAEWRDRFTLRYVYLIKYVFCPENALRVFDEVAAMYESEMPRHIAKWHFISSMNEWHSQLSALRACIENRGPYAERYLKSLFRITDTQFSDYVRRAEIIHAGGSDPGPSAGMPATPAPAATPTPTQPAEQPGPTATPTPTPTPGTEPGPTSTPTPTPAPTPEG